MSRTLARVGPSCVRTRFIFVLLTTILSAISVRKALRSDCMCSRSSLTGGTFSQHARILSLPGTSAKAADAPIETESAKLFWVREHLPRRGRGVLEKWSHEKFVDHSNVVISHVLVSLSRTLLTLVEYVRIAAHTFSLHGGLVFGICAASTL